MFRLLRTTDCCCLALNCFLLLKEENDGDKSENSEVEKKTKPQKRSKISEDIQVELVINDITEPTAEHLSASKQK